MLDELYKLTARDTAPFGSNVVDNLPKVLPHGQEIRLARYAGEGDGQDVEVYATALPSSFFKIKAIAGTNSIGENLKGYTFSTGTDQAKLAADIAVAISQGMLGVEL